MASIAEHFIRSYRRIASTANGRPRPVPYKASWLTVGGAPALVDTDSGSILAGCPGLEDEDLDEITDESPESRERRERKQDKAEAGGYEPQEQQDARKAWEQARAEIDDADTVVLLKLGDQYYSFDGDAALLQTVLDVGDGEVADFKEGALDTFLGDLVDAGHRVAIAERTEHGGARHTRTEEPEDDEPDPWDLPDSADEPGSGDLDEDAGDDGTPDEDDTGGDGDTRTIAYAGQRFDIRAGENGWEYRPEGREDADWREANEDTAAWIDSRVEDRTTDEAGGLTSHGLTRRTGDQFERIQQALGYKTVEYGDAGAERINRKLGKMPGGRVISALLAVPGEDYDDNGYASRGMDAYRDALDRQFSRRELAAASRWMDKTYSNATELGNVNQNRWLKGVVDTVTPKETSADFGGDKRFAKAVREAIGDDPEDQARFRDLALDIWDRRKKETADQNHAYRDFLAQFGVEGGARQARFIQLVQRAEDYDQIKHFDDMTKIARRDYPQLLEWEQGESVGKDDAELALFQRLKTGLIKPPAKHSKDVISEAMDYVEAAERSTPSKTLEDVDWSKVEFRRRSRKWWQLVRYVARRVHRQLYSWDESKHPRDDAGRFSEVRSSGEPGTIRLYRAADYADSRVGFSFSEEPDVAQEYLDNPGFGGDTLFSVEVEVDPSTVLDLSESSDPWQELAEAAGIESIPQERYQYHFARILPTSDEICEALEEAGYHWVRFEDDYPEGAITMIPVSDEAADSADDMDVHED